MADPVAIWGGVTGTIALLLNLWKEIRDRPKLTITQQAGVTEDSPAWIGLDVSNRGRRPVTVMATGFQIAVEVEVGNESRPDVPVRTVLPRLRGHEDPRVVPPGEVARFRYAVRDWPSPLVHADFPLRGYVIDSYGKTAWGSAWPLLRRLLASGWKPPLGTDATLLGTLPEPMAAVPLEPRWKAWRDYLLRKVGRTVPNPRYNFVVGELQPLEKATEEETAPPRSDRS